jgi:hypothetical protein
MAQGMAQQRQLAVVEPIGALQEPLQHGHLIDLALQIGVQIGESLLDHRPLGQQHRMNEHGRGFTVGKTA